MRDAPAGARMSESSRAVVSGPAATFLSLSVCGCVMSVQPPLFSVSPSADHVVNCYLRDKGNITEFIVYLDANFDICIWTTRLSPLN